MSGIVYEECIVTFIDILGFRSMLKNHEAEEIYDIITKLKTFTEPEKEPPIERLKYARMESQAFADSISDAVVRVRTINTQFRDGALFWELLDLVHAQIDLIKHDILIRAGLTIGDIYVGIEGEGPIFGKALARAYEIESNEAVYPRILIDDIVLKHLKDNSQLWREGHNIKDELSAIGGFLRAGEDGALYIDYLRAGELEFDEQFDFMEFLSKHQNIIENGIRSNSNVRVLRKYLWLAHYHNTFITEKLEYVSSNGAVREGFKQDTGTDAIKFYESMIIAT